MTTMPVAEINAIRARTAAPPPNADYGDVENPIGWDPGFQDIKTYCLGPDRVAVSFANVEKVLNGAGAEAFIADLRAKITEATR